MPRKICEHQALFFIKMGNWRQILIHFSISSIVMDKIEETAKISIFVLIYKKRYSITDVPTLKKVNKTDKTAFFANLLRLSLTWLNKLCPKQFSVLNSEGFQELSGFSVVKRIVSPKLWSKRREVSR